MAYPNCPSWHKKSNALWICHVLDELNCKGRAHLLQAKLDPQCVWVKRDGKKLIHNGGSSLTYLSV